VGAFDSVFEGSYAARVVTATHMELTHTASGAHASGSGTIGVADHGPQLDLVGTWKQFRWPLAGRAAAVRSAAGEFALRGVWPYELRGSGDLAVSDLQPMPVQIVGSLSKDSLLVSEGHIAAFGGSAQAAGEIAWAPKPKWNATGTVADFNPATLRKEL